MLAGKEQEWSYIFLQSKHNTEPKCLNYKLCAKVILNIAMVTWLFAGTICVHFDIHSTVPLVFESQSLKCLPLDCQLWFSKKLKSPLCSVNCVVFCNISWLFLNLSILLSVIFSYNLMEDRIWATQRAFIVTERMQSEPYAWAERAGFSPLNIKPQDKVSSF